MLKTYNVFLKMIIASTAVILMHKGNDRELGYVKADYTIGLLENGKKINCMDVLRESVEIVFSSII
jgi:hypothetical protein